MKIQGNTYQERCQSQLDLWVKGESIHNKVDDECCPDFSCCVPDLQADKETRDRFANFNEAEREEMLVGFLGSALSKETNVEVVTSKDIFQP